MVWYFCDIVIVYIKIYLLFGGLVKKINIDIKFYFCNKLKNLIYGYLIFR